MKASQFNREYVYMYSNTYIFSLLEKRLSLYSSKVLRNNRCKLRVREHSVVKWYSFWKRKKRKQREKKYIDAIGWGKCICKPNFNTRINFIPTFEEKRSEWKKKEEEKSTTFRGTEESCVREN